MYMKFYFRHDVSGFSRSVTEQLIVSEQSILNRVGEWVILKVMYAFVGAGFTLYLLSHGSMSISFLGALFIGFTILVLERGSISSSHKEVSKLSKAILLVIAITAPLLFTSSFHVLKNGNEICATYKKQVEAEYDQKIIKLDSKLNTAREAKDNREHLLNEEMKTGYKARSKVKRENLEEQRSLFKKAQIHHDSMMVQLSIQKEADLLKYSSIMNIGFVKALDIFLGYRGVAHYLTSFCLFIFLTVVDIWVVLKTSEILTPDSAYWKKHQEQEKIATEANLKLLQNRQKSIYQKQVRDLKDQELLYECDTKKLELKENTMLKVYGIIKHKEANKVQVKTVTDRSIEIIDSITFIAKSEKEARNMIKEGGGNPADYDSIFDNIRKSHFESLIDTNTSHFLINKTLSKQAIKKLPKPKRA